MAQCLRKKADFATVCLSPERKTRNSEDDMALHCTDRLIQEHRLILRAVYVLQAMAERARNQVMPASADVDRLLLFFKAFADEHHQGKEEAVLFPALKCRDKGKVGGPLHQMMFEHEQERSLVEGLEDALRTNNSADFTYYGGRLAAILASHIYKEDNILFDLVEKTIPREMDEALVAEMDAFDRCICRGSYDEMVRLVSDLEWKYIVKTVGVGD
jgi:hemerythrin-like domain-containing protein